METVRNIDDIEKLNDNEIIGQFSLTNSVITFKGKNNILYCENNINITNSTISFEGDNSIVYLSSTNYNYPLILVIHSNSTVYIGKNNNIFSPFNIGVQESQNVIIGDDGIIASGVNIRTSDAHPIYSCKSKKRINFSESVFIGDHVWLSHLSYISKGTHIGSGSIIGNKSFIQSNFCIPSNSYALGNPAKIIYKDVFFTKDFAGRYKHDETLEFSTYKSNVFMYEFVKKETLSINNIDKLLKDLTVGDRLIFIEKLFVKNKRKNRFFIG